MDLPTFISRMSPFTFLGVLGGIFHFFPNFNHRTFCKQIVKLQIRNTTLCSVSDLGLHCLPMSHEKER